MLNFLPFSTCFKKLSAFLLIILFFFSCKKKTHETSNIFKFREYISYTTAGRVSVASPIEINFSKDIASWNENEEIDEPVFSIEPSVSGVFKVKNKHTLVFIPDETLEPDTEYTIKVPLHKLFKNVPSQLKTYTFQFKTITPNFTINTPELQSYTKNWQYINGDMRLADVVPLKHAKNIITATQNGKKLTIKWDESTSVSKNFSFTIDSIQRFVEDSKIIVSWNGKAIDIDKKGENTITIPGKSNFTITGIEIVQTPNQYVAINFSDPLQKEQDFKGLVQIEDATNLKYIVDGNILKIYSENSLLGTKNLEVFQGIKNEEGYKLKNIYSRLIAFDAAKPDIKLLRNGVFLPNSEHLNLTFEAVNLKAVDVRIIKVYSNNILQLLQTSNLNTSNADIRRVGRRIAKKTITLQDENENTGKWKAYSIDLSNYFTADPGAIYRVELEIKKDYAIYNCTTSKKEEEEFYYDGDYRDTYSISDEYLREEAYWDNEVYSYKREYYNWNDRKNPCKEAYYANKRIAQNLIGSNLGVIVKKGATDNYYFAVSNLLTTTPEANTNIALYNYQQQPIQNAITDGEGLAIIKSAKKAAFAIISKNNQKTYVKLNDANSLSLSIFNVSGEKVQKGLKGYLYGERGVWRPGDTLHLSFVLEDQYNKLPKAHPVTLEVTNPTGKLMYRKTATNALNNVYVFPVATKPEDQTGTWNATVQVGGVFFRKSLKIETIKPNRLKILVDFNKEQLSTTENNTGTIQVNWLHGAPAKNVKTEIKAKLFVAKNAFSKYPEYHFLDPTRKFNSEEINVHSGTVNENGTGKFTARLNVGKEAPGMLKANFLVRAFENSGDFSMDAFSKPLAPFSSFVGLKVPKTNNYNAFDTNKNNLFQVLTVTETSNINPNRKLEVYVYKINWRWWWNATNNDVASYQSSSSKETYKKFTITSNSRGEATFNLNIPEEDRGRYLIRIIDPISKHATGKVVYFFEDWYAPSEDKEAAKILVFSSDKDHYKTGETARIKFPSSAGSRALISVENGSEIVEYKWVATTDKETKTNIPITAEMAPNIYITISLVQPHATTKNDLPIRLFGILPINVENPETKLHPEIKMPSVLKPQQEFEVFVSEENNKDMTYTLAVVEEGLLDLTRFKTPNAWDAFYKQEALGVKTWDIYDNVVGAYSGSLEQVFAIGGDENLAAGKNKKANRFKPVVTFLGPFHLDGGEQNSHKIKLPNYIGSVRTMVVASNALENAYGNAEKAVAVKKPLMVMATLPRKLSPGEKVTLPVTVFAMEPHIKNVSVELVLSPGLATLGNTRQSLYFEKPDEKMIYFDLDVSKAKGIQTVEIISKANGERSSYKVELDVENTNPISTISTKESLEANASKNLNFSTFGVAGTNSAVVEFSTLPPMDFTSRLEYLIQYPHGCLEQTTSSAFPQLFMADIFELSEDKKQEIQKNIKKAIQRIGYFQLPNGGLSYWIGEHTNNDWATSYAGHFLLEAEKKGYALPLTFKSNWVSYQKQVAHNWRPSYRYGSGDLAQAYRLYTLALAGVPDLGAMNRLREFEEISNDAKWRLAAAYALAGQKEASKKLMASCSINFTSKRDYYTYGSTNRNRAMALETMVLTKDTRMREVAETIAKSLSSNEWMSTQTTSYSLLAMAKLVEANGGKAMQLQYTINGKTKSISTQKAIAQQKLVIHEGLNTLQLYNRKDNLVYVRVLTSGKLPLGEEIAEQRGLHLEISYTNNHGKALNISNLQQGQDFTAIITVQNLKNYEIENVALTQIFPSGWEIVNTRFTAFGTTNENPAKYSDIRDDRVSFYFDLSKKGAKKDTKTFAVQLNASYLGTYYLPGTQVEAMYDNEFFVRNTGKWITVNRE